MLLLQSLGAFAKCHTSGKKGLIAVHVTQLREVHKGGREGEAREENPAMYVYTEHSTMEYAIFLYQIVSSSSSSLYEVVLDTKGKRENGE